MDDVDKVKLDGIFPSQCKCGHIYLKRHHFKNVTNEGYIGFWWCEFCRTKYMVKPKEIKG